MFLEGGYPGPFCVWGPFQGDLHLQPKIRGAVLLLKKFNPSLDPMLFWLCGSLLKACIFSSRVRWSPVSVLAERLFFLALGEEWLFCLCGFCYMCVIFSTSFGIFWISFCWYIFHCLSFLCFLVHLLFWISFCWHIFNCLCFLWLWGAIFTTRLHGVHYQSLFVLVRLLYQS